MCMPTRDACSSPPSSSACARAARWKAWSTSVHGCPSVPGEAVLQAAAPPLPSAKAPLLRTTPPTVPVNGKVTAQFKNVALDAILDMVSQPPFQRLGIGALLNGPATATWTKGDMRTVSVAANAQPVRSHAAAGG